MLSALTKTPMCIYTRIYILSISFRIARRAGTTHEYGVPVDRHVVLRVDGSIVHVNACTLSYMSGMLPQVECIVVNQDILRLHSMKIRDHKMHTA